MIATRLVACGLAAGVLLLVVRLADGAAAAAMAPGVAGRLIPALLVNAGATAVVWLEGAVTRSGAIVGGLLGVLIYLGAGWEGWVMLVATFGCAVIASNVGWDRKQARGIAQEDGGRRSARHAIANCGVAAVAAVVGMTAPYQSDAWIALVAALTAAGADTAASEIGKAFGRHTFLIVGLRPVPPGTPGAISLEGSIANAVAAFALAALGAAVGLVAASAIPAVAACALVGAGVESVLAATLEARGMLNNDLLNFMNSAVAAGAAVYLI